MATRSRVVTDLRYPYRAGLDETSAKIQREWKVQAKQVTTSQSNPWPSNKGSGGDVGSNFTTERERIVVDTPLYGRGEHRNSYGTLTNSYHGPIFSYDPTRALGEIRGHIKWTSDLTLNGMGATAIANVLPTNPSTDAMTFAAELASDGIPKAVGQSLWKNRRNPIKGLADEHLNYQFGVAPTVNDTMSLVDTISKSDKILKQYERDSGRNIHRKYRFPIYNYGSGGGPVPSWQIRSPKSADSTVLTNLVTGGQWTMHETLSREVWFSGCFTYYLNLGKSKSDRLEYAAQQAKRLYGVRLTPDVLWNLAPWSWAADWVTNMGDILTNLSAFSTDGLVMRYGYIMETSRMMKSYSCSGLRPALGANFELTGGRCSETYSLTRKVRRKATPFGFGLDPGQFTGRQWSILAALGITRGMR